MLPFLGNFYRHLAIFSGHTECNVGLTHWLGRSSKDDKFDHFLIGAVFIGGNDPVFSGVSPFAIVDLELGVVRHVLDGETVGVGDLLT